MTSDLFHKIFDQAFAIKDVSKREEFLQQQCGEDDALKLQLSEMFAALDKAGSFLDPKFQISISSGGGVVLPGDGDENTLNIVEEELKPGTRIGRFVLNKELGVGGFGEVYLAHQIEPVSREVAVKLIKTGLNTKQVAARFDAERQVLAVMSHEAIAKVFDGGTTKGGRPYFVMEYVDGLPINDYCDQNQLSVDERLRLIVRVCNAVHYAHQKGVLHRDIKPSNILVAESENLPQPKLIDFGIAKLLDPSEKLDGVKSAEWQLLGTPKYMSPEQAKLGQQNVDVRSDVYSLGIVLYELLTGSTPVDHERFQSLGFEQVFNELKDSKVVKPSQKVKTTKFNDEETARSLAMQRMTDALNLARKLEGDLDCILLKSLAFEPDQRYQSIREFSDDISRFLAGDPIVARPASSLYRIGKYIRKNYVALSAASIVVATILAAAGISVWQVSKTNQARIAESEQTELFKEFFKFTNSILKSPSPQIDGKEQKVVDLLKEKKQQIQDSFVDRPELRLRMLHNMGITFVNLGLREEGSELLNQALDLAESIDHLDGQPAIECLAFLAIVNFDSNFDLALQQLELAWNRLENIEKDNSTVDEMRVNVLNLKGRALFMQGKNDEARNTLNQALQSAEEVLDEDHSYFINILNNIASVEQRAGNLEGTLRTQEKLFERLSSQKNADKYSLLNLSKSLAFSYIASKREADALPVMKIALPLSFELHGEESIDAQKTQLALAIAEAGTGMLEPALKRLDRALQIQQTKFPENLFLEMELRSGKGLACSRAKNFEKAAVYTQEVLEFVLSHPELGDFGRRHSFLIRRNLANTFESLRNYVDSKKAYEENYELFKNNKLILPKEIYEHVKKLSFVTGQLAQPIESISWLDKAIDHVEEVFDQNGQEIENEIHELLENKLALAAKANDVEFLEKNFMAIESNVLGRLNRDVTTLSAEAKTNYLELLASLYSQWGKQDKLKDVQIRLLE